MASEKTYKELLKKYKPLLSCSAYPLPLKGSFRPLRYFGIATLFLIVFILSSLSTPGNAQEVLPRDEYFNKKIEPRSFDKTKWKSLTKDFNYEEDGAVKESSTHRKANTTGEGEEEEEEAPVGKMSPFWAAVFKWTIVGMAISIFAVLLYNVLGSGSIFKAKGKKIPTKKDTFSIETIEANIHESDLDQHIHEALQQNNYTLAIRLYYLAVIKELSLNKWIKWKRDKTNRDYLREMRPTALFTSYQDTTRIFERVFYGNVTIQEQDFVLLKPRFVDLLNKIRNSKLKG
ncbi:MAG: hypothetical protein ACI8YQ_002689 [Polaribacter sp.]